MDTHAFVEGFDANVSWAYQPWLFTTYDHVRLQQKDGWIFLFAKHLKHQAIEAHVYIHVADRNAVSPVKATFGGVQFLSSIAPDILYRFIAYVTETIRERGVEHLTLKFPPEQYYGSKASLLHTFLFNQGYVVTTAEVGALMAMEGEFERKIHTWEKRRLKQARLVGLNFGIEPSSHLEMMFDFIEVCRQERGYKLGIDKATLQKTFDHFSNRFFFFSLRSSESLVAASICIDVGNGFLYNFHSAHLKQYDHLSPVVKLLEGIFSFGKQRSFQWLDLGTSAIHGQPNFGLLGFKLRLGAKSSMKLTFSKSW